MDIHDKQDCIHDIDRIRDLLNCGIFTNGNTGNIENILRPSAFIELMISLNDLLHKTEKYTKRISFTDDIMLNQYVHDVTDAITAVRDACCHINSYKLLLNDRGSRGSLLVMYGKGTMLKLRDIELKSDYEDDIAFFYGLNRLYLKRHIVRAFEEATTLLEPMLYS